MALVQTLRLAHLPPSLAVHIALYRDVQNASFLRQQLLQGNPEYEYAFIDASTIISPNHLLAAVFRAANDYLNKRLKSRNVHSEIVFALSPNNNIATSFRTFGLTDSTTSLLIVKLSTNPSVTSSSISSHLSTAVKGTATDHPLESISEISNLNAVRKIYKIKDVGRGGGEKRDRDEEQERRELEVMVIGIMALRGQT